MFFFSKKAPAPPQKPSAALLCARFTERLDSLLADYADDVGARRIADELERRAQLLRIRYAVDEPIR
jgi:hypothetical protein